MPESVHLVANNAGIEEPLQPAIEATKEVHREVLDTNLWGVIAGCRAQGRVMRPKAPAP
jgi:NAD(P)-dependent dehydrogenase (short-subunit alcohol dehydrogenase family)